MLYKGLKFPLEAKRPYFYSNFVTTIDGKAQVLVDTKKYWPLGSRLDYETLIELRTYADALIHGSGTTLAHEALRSLCKPEFHSARKNIGMKNPILYIVTSNHPTENLIPKLKSDHPMVRTMLITSRESSVSEELAKATEIVRLGTSSVDIGLLPAFLQKRKVKIVLVEGGPTLMGSFFKENLMDEIFLTIAPKVVGNMPGKTLTMVEGYLYPPTEVPSFDLVSCKQVKNELYLRYRLTKR